jgi:hypothetical protein
MASAEPYVCYVDQRSTRHAISSRRAVVAAGLLAVAVCAAVSVRERHSSATRPARVCACADTCGAGARFTLGRCSWCRLRGSSYRLLPPVADSLHSNMVSRRSACCLTSQVRSMRLVSLILSSFLSAILQRSMHRACTSKDQRASSAARPRLFLARVSCSEHVHKQHVYRLLSRSSLHDSIFPCA